MEILNEPRRRFSRRKIKKTWRLGISMTRSVECFVPFLLAGQRPRKYRVVLGRFFLNGWKFGTEIQPCYALFEMRPHRSVDQQALS